MKLRYSAGLFLCADLFMLFSTFLLLPITLSTRRSDGTLRRLTGLANNPTGVLLEHRKELH